MDKDNGNSEFFAHSLPERPTSEWEPLEVHLREVADQSRKFADAFGSGDWGYLAGLWHDLGKYRPLFQRRIRGEPVSAPHAVVGAVHAERSGNSAALALAFAIAGHHAGLANAGKSRDGAPRPLREQLKTGRALYAEIDGAVPASVVAHEIPPLPDRLRAASTGADPAHSRKLAHWTRFLFSALVDADYLATESFMAPSRALERGTYDSPKTLEARIESYLKDLLRRVPEERRGSDVNRARADVLRWCREAASEPPGLFSLTVPTGGGKTLSGMAFALEHAVAHGLRRVIVALPFTSIIEQNAAVYRDALGAENVIEHHANLDPERQVDTLGGEISRQHERAAENWDAPVIVTTTVQFFESLFANRPSRCRKLHNIARSVIILDEVQTLPRGLLLPVLDVLKELITTYGCTVVLSTATPPALTRRESLEHGLPAARVIVKEPQQLYSRLERVEIEWRTVVPLAGWASLADELATHDKALVIVDRRADAHALAEELQMRVVEPVFHLSALMCPAHRLETIERIRLALENDVTCRVVSTQLVEAGVDLDFPIVYRALAGLDRVLQASGRCNREGKLARGRVIVFDAPKPPPTPELRGAYDATRTMLNQFPNGIPVDDVSVFEQFFRLYYGTPVDERDVLRECQEFNFANAAAAFKLIDDANQTTVIVPWGQGRERLAAFRQASERGGLSKEYYRSLQPYAVQIYPDQRERLERAGILLDAGEGFYELTPGYRHLYSETYGVIINADSRSDPKGLMS